MMRLDEILNARRTQLGWTYEEVHARLESYAWPPGVQPPSLPVVGHWFNGRRRPRKMEHLRALCDVLDLSLDEAIGGTAEPATAVEQQMLQAMRELDPAAVELLLAMAAKLKGR